MIVRGNPHYGDIAQNHASSYTSQAGEDGIVEEIFKRLGVSTGWFVEVGANNGVTSSNTRRLFEAGWKGVYIEGDPSYYAELVENTKDNSNVHLFHQFINCEAGTRLDDVLDQTAILDDFDLFSLDIDSIDYWVWKSLKRKPKVVIVEYNCAAEYDECKTVAYEPSLRFGNSDYFGATLGAYAKLAQEKGYILVAVSHRLNLIFVDAKYAEHFIPLDPKDVPRSHSFPADARQKIDV